MGLGDIKPTRALQIERCETMLTIDPQLPVKPLDLCPRKLVVGLFWIEFYTTEPAHPLGPFVTNLSFLYLPPRYSAICEYYRNYSMFTLTLVGGLLANSVDATDNKQVPVK